MWPYSCDYPHACYPYCAGGEYCWANYYGYCRKAPRSWVHVYLKSSCVVIVGIAEDLRA